MMRSGPQDVPGADTANLGDRLKLITTEGDYDGDGIIEQAYAFGSRSFRIYDANGNLIFDSGNQLAELAKAAGIYDDGRSDDKGTEPETVITQVINGSTYAFVALERGISSTTAVFDVSDPYQPSFVRLLNSPGSVSPEGLEYVSTEPNGSGFLTAANEVSGTFDLFEFSRDVKLSADRNEFNGGPAVEMAVEFDVSGFTTDSIYTIGESNDLQITGIPDGQGAYRVDGNTIRVLVNSELRPDLGYSYQLGSGAELVGARVNFIDVNNAGQVVGGGIAYNTVYDRMGNLVLNSDQVNGGFNRFCSANLVEADTFGPGRGAADRLFLLGEESGNAGSMWILDVANGELWAAPDLGYGSWESATMVDTGRTDTVAYVLGDDFNPGPLYLYLGTKDPSGNVLERNGLIGGQMYYWKSDNGITNHDEAIANGLTQGNSDSGSWVAIDVQDAAMAGEPGYDDEGYKFGDTLRTEVIAGGGFVGYRVEDLDFNPNDPTQLVFNTTGGQSDNGAGVTDRFGSMWILDLEFDGNGDPGATTLKHLYDGDADGNQQAGVRSPDNLAWSGDGFIYVQEDRSTDWEGEEASIFKVDAESGEAERILQINRDAVLPDGQVDARTGQLGAWESSGIIDVSHLYGNAPGTDFFFNVQAHGVGGGAIEEFDLVEGGQILVSSAPDTTPADPYVDGVAPGVETTALYTIGEAVNGYIGTGIPDGQGAFLKDETTIRLLVNSELRPDQGYSYELSSGAELVGARVNFIDIDKDSNAVLGGGLAYGEVYDRAGAVVTDADQVNGGFNRFCSANLVEADTFGPGRGAADRLFLLGEESGNAGSMWILDVANGELWAAPDLGYGSWESATMVDTGRTDTVAYVLGDDFNPGPLYLYLGTKDPSGNVLERNGLIGGQMYYWKSDNGITNHDEAIANGLTQGNSDSGSWVAIDVQDAAMAGEPGYDDEGYKFGDTLRTEVIAGGGFVGYRVEDLDFNPNDPTQLVFNTTGGQSDNGAGVTDRFGSMWILDLEFDGNGDPGATTLKHLYDGDADGNQQAGVRSPDNLAWSGDGFIYVQEDRSTDWEGEEASIFKVDAESGEAERILQINRDAVLPDGQVDARAGQLGAWESSGIIDVSHLYGNAPGTDFFFNVQAHGVGGGAIEEFDLVEGGQILRATIEQPFTLQLLHFADGEAGLLASGTAPNLAALVDGFDDDYANTLILAGGDNFIPGPFLAAGTDSSVAATHDKGDNPGAADIEIHNRIGVEASAIGNHEFDLGTRAFRDAVDDAEFPYISANLDFSGDVDLASRFTDTVGPGLEDVTTLAGRIAHIPTSNKAE